VRSNPLWSLVKTASKKARVVRFCAPRVLFEAKMAYKSMGRKEVSVISIPASAVLLAITIATMKK